MLSKDSIALRPFEQQHAQEALQLINHPTIAAGLMRHLPVTMLEHQNWYEQLMSDSKNLYFSVCYQAMFIGCTGLRQIDMRNQKAAFFIFLNGRYTKKGWGTLATELCVQYAFKYLNLHKVYLEVLSTNTAAIQLYQKVGFQQAGVFKKDYFSEGSFKDVLYFELLRDE